jgi:hypothetical protein
MATNIWEPIRVLNVDINANQTTVLEDGFAKE